jgi:hypothetical protein
MTATAELSSIATALEELTARVASIGAGLSGEERDQLGSELLEVERHLGAANRRLGRVLGNQRGGRPPR